MRFHLTNHDATYIVVFNNRICFAIKNDTRQVEFVQACRPIGYYWVHSMYNTWLRDV